MTCSAWLQSSIVQNLLCDFKCTEFIVLVEDVWEQKLAEMSCVFSGATLGPPAVQIMKLWQTCIRPTFSDSSILRQIKCCCCCEGQWQTVSCSETKGEQGNSSLSINTCSLFVAGGNVPHLPPNAALWKYKGECATEKKGGREKRKWRENGCRVRRVYLRMKLNIQNKDTDKNEMLMTN